MELSSISLLLIEVIHGQRQLQPVSEKLASTHNLHHLISVSYGLCTFLTIRFACSEECLLFTKHQCPPSMTKIGHVNVT